MKELAEKIHKTVSFLSQVERGLAEPSITSLRKIADALNVPIFYFLLSSNDEDSIVRKNQRKVITSAGYQASFELLSPNLSHSMEIIQGRLQPGGVTCDVPLSHAGEESILVLAGKMQIQVGDDIYTLEEGDNIYYLASMPHKITNTGEVELVFISSITPPSF